MLYTKDGYPEVNEIVKCTVNRIYGNTTFVHLDEYDKEGVLTISEIAPGRIRNLRDHVIENKEIVCKVLRVDERQNRIDVSLRRVPIPVMKDKLEEVKKEEYAERIYDDVAHLEKLSKDELFEKTYEVIFENYNTIFEALYEIMLDNEKVSIFSNLSDSVKNSFIKVINERIKPEEVTLKEKFTLRSTNPEGIKLIKEAISNTLKTLNHEKIKITYLAAGEFSLIIKHDDMKSAGKIFNKFRDELTKEAKDNKLELKIKEN